MSIGPVRFGAPARWRSNTLCEPLALAAALLALLPLLLHVTVAEYDEAIFLDVARNIQRTGLPLRSLTQSGILFFDHTPLYVYMLSLLPSSGAAGLLLTRLVTVAAGLSCVLLTFLIAKRPMGVGVGLLAATLLGLNPFFATYSFFVRMEVFMVLAMLAGLWLLLNGLDTERTPRMLAAGVLFAVAVLLKEVAVLLPIVAALYVWRVWPTRAHSFKVGLGVGMPTALALAGWAVWAYELSPGTFTATISRWFSSASSMTVNDPRAWITTLPWARQLACDLLGPALVVGLAISALRLSVRGETDRGKHLGLLWIYVISAIGASFFVRLKEPRHVIGILPFASILAAIAFRQVVGGLLGRLPAPRRRVLLILVACVMVLAASPLRLPQLNARNLRSWLAPVYAQRLYDNDRFYSVLAQVGRQLRTLTAQGELITVAHQGPVVGYYADRPYLMLYTSPKEGIIQTLRRADYLVWDDPIFLALESSQIQAVEEYVAAHFTSVQIVQDGQRQVTIYRGHGR